MHPALTDLPIPADVREQVVLEAKYAGYIGRQAVQVERFQKLESPADPGTLRLRRGAPAPGRGEEKLGRIRPATSGQASRISGISPADLAVLMIYLE